MFNVDEVRLQIEAILRDYPDLADDPVALFDTLDGATNLREVLVDLGRRLGLNAAMLEGLEAYIGDLHTRAGRFERRELYLRDLMFHLMDSAQLKKIELPEVTLSLRNSPPKLVGEADPDLLPDDLVYIKRTVNRTAIKAAIEAGQHVEGFALSNAAPSLTVKIK
jgi:hypothetical protein